MRPRSSLVKVLWKERRADLVVALHGTKGNPGYSKLHPGSGGGADAAADALLKRVASDEKAVSSSIVGLVKDNGGEMFQFDQRVKSKDSLRRKIQTKRDADPSKSYGEVADTISDSFRYTAVFDDGGYVDGVKATVDGLEGQGNRVLKAKNYWAPGDSYRGLNYTMQTKSGNKFEVQFHTKASSRAVLRNHKAFEKARLPSVPQPEKERLWSSMVKVADSVTAPKGVENIGTPASQTIGYV